MYYSAIKYYDIANGPGVRTVLFVSGCRNHCEGCFQPETWNFENGEKFEKSTEDEILKSLEPDYITGFTLLGGDPFEEENQRAILPLLQRMKKAFPKKSVWAYTGYILDKDLLNGQRKNTEVTEEVLSLIDVLVDGPFIQEKKNIMLKFRGSENQRIIDMKYFLEHRQIKEMD